MRYRVRTEQRSALLGENDIILGRSPYSTLVIEHASVSRLHAVMRVVDDVVVLEDMKSSNGTFVHGGRLQAPRVVKPGDDISIGSVKLVLEVAPEWHSTSTSAGAAVEVPSRDTQQDPVEHAGIKP